MLLDTPNLNLIGDEFVWNTLGCNTKQHPNKTPSKRWGQSLCELNDKLYLFGGYAELSYFNELWTFDLKSFHWELLSSKEGTPDPRSNHTMLNDPKSAKLILFGGSGAKKKRFNDLYFFDTEKKIWNSVETEPASRPATRTYHAATIVDQSMVIHGGEGTEDLDDLHIFDLGLLKWCQPKIVGPKPGRRRFHSANTVNKSVIIFGGCHQNYEGYSDLWRIDFTPYFENKSNVLSWVQIDIKGDNPSPRWGHLALFKPNCLFLFGGKTTVDTADLYAINLDTNDSLKIRVKASPVGRRKPGGALYKNHVLIYGGYNGDYLSDLLCLNLGFSPMRIADKTLEKEFKSLCFSQEPGNFTIFFNEFEISTHSYLLQRSDPSFSQLLQKKEREIRVKIPEISEEAAFRSFIQFLYTNYLDENIANEDLENFVIISRALQLQETEQYLKFVIALREGKNQKSPLIKPNGPTEGEVLALIQHLKEFEKVAESPEDINNVSNSTNDECQNVYEDKLLAVLNTDPDLVLYSKNDKYPCHRTVLAIRSAYFKNLLEAGFKESYSKSFPLPLKKRESLLVFLYYIYFDIEEDFFKKTITCEDDWSELMIFAKYAHLERLANFCERQVESYLTPDNFFDHLYASRKYFCEILTASVLNYIVTNFHNLKLKTRLVVWESENPGKSKEFSGLLKKELKSSEFCIVQNYQKLIHLGIELDSSKLHEELISTRGYLKELNVASESSIYEIGEDSLTVSNKIHKGLE